MKRGVNTKSRQMSIVICLLMITSISTPITQNVGQLPNAGQSQNLVQSDPGPTSGGSGSLADSPWPTWRYNLRRTGQSPYNTSSNPGLLRWSFTTGDQIYSSPSIVSDGTIYIGSNDHKLYAINPDGTEKWSFSTGGPIDYSSPTIASDGTIFIGNDGNGKPGKMFAINPDGTEKWNFTTADTEVDTSAAIGSDGTIYFGADDGIIYALNSDGTEKWSFITGKSVEQSPAIGSDGTIYAGSGDKHLYAINPNGTEKWNFTNTGQGDGALAIGSDDTIYSHSFDTMYAIKPDGSEKWNFTFSSMIWGTGPAIASDGTIYIGSFDYKLYAINSDGTEKWNFTAGHNVLSPPSIGLEGTIYVGSDDYKLYAINLDGTEKWNYTTGKYIRSSPAIGSDGTIYVGSRDGKLYAIGNQPSLTVNVTSHFSSLNSAAQSLITIHVTDGTNPVQGATINLVSDNGGIFSPQSGITDVNGDFKSIFNAPTITSQIICRISAEAGKTGYNDGSGYVDVTINPIPWPMFRQNLNHTGQSPYDTSSNNGNLKWSYMTGGSVDSSPTIGPNNIIYVGSDDNKLYAINPNGTEKWNFTTGAHVNSSPSFGSDGTIYFGSWDKKVYALYPDGTEKWSFTTDAHIDSSPAIGADGTIYIGSGDKKLYAINPDGSEKWNFMTGWDVWSSPAIGVDGTIYVGSEDNKLYAINPDGTEKWSFITGRWVWSSPAIWFDSTIYVGSKDYKLYAVNSNGTEKWNFTTGGSVISSPAIGADGTIYVGSHDNKLYAINPDGTEKWNFTTSNSVYSSPAIGFDGTIYISSYDNYVYAINSDGTEKWRFNNGFGTQSSPTIGSDGTIYIGSRDDNLYAIGAPVQNQPPIANAGPNQTVNEGNTLQFNASSSCDPDGTIEYYEWDFDSSDGLWWETGAVPDATGPTPTHTYGDNGVFIVTLRVTDNDNLSATDSCNATVQNVDPTVTIESVRMEVEIGLRVAGRKYNNVSMTLYEDGSQLGYVSIERMPGSPDEQMVWIPVSINFSKSYNATVFYTPEDPPNVGGNPVWIYIKSKDGTIKKIHHTFNVQQSKKRDSEHWNHVEPWDVDLNDYFIGLSFEITSHITDPGSDDETLTYTYGSQTVTVTYLNSPPNPDLYPSPEIKPVDIVDTTTLVYEGPGIITLVVKDDDNIRSGIGQGSDSFTL